MDPKATHGRPVSFRIDSLNPTSGFLKVRLFRLKGTYLWDIGFNGWTIGWRWYSYTIGMGI